MEAQAVFLTSPKPILWGSQCDPVATRAFHQSRFLGKSSLFISAVWLYRLGEKNGLP
jgi:hypothetical protein